MTTSDDNERRFALLAAGAASLNLFFADHSRARCHEAFATTLRIPLVAGVFGSRQSVAAWGVWLPLHMRKGCAVLVH